MVSRFYARRNFTTMLSTASGPGLAETLVRDLIGANSRLSGLAKFALVSPSISIGSINFQVPGELLLRATPNIDPTIPGGFNTSDIIWGMIVNYTSNSFSVAWGNMRRDGANDVGRVEISSNGLSDGRRSITVVPPRRTRGSGNSVQVIVESINASNPYGYNLTVTDYGFALVAFNQTKAFDFSNNSVTCVQRPINPDGSVYLDNKAPLFAIYNNASQISAGTNFFREYFVWYIDVLRESDFKSTEAARDLFPPGGTGAAVARSISNFPHRRTDIFKYLARRNFSNPTEYNQTRSIYEWPLDWEQPRTTDDGNIAYIFPSGLTTSRFVYPQELDLIGLGPAEAFAFGTNIDVNRFSEAREYTVSVQHDPFNDGVSMIQLSDGPDFRTV